MKNRKQTSTRIAELAGKTLADERSSKKAKSLAASALAQARNPRRKAGNQAKTA